MYTKLWDIVTNLHLLHLIFASVFLSQYSHFVTFNPLVRPSGADCEQGLVDSNCSLRAAFTDPQSKQEREASCMCSNLFPTVHSSFSIPALVFFFFLSPFASWQFSFLCLFHVNLYFLSSLQLCGEKKKIFTKRKSVFKFLQSYSSTLLKRF